MPRPEHTADQKDTAVRLIRLEYTLISQANWLLKGTKQTADCLHGQAVCEAAAATHISNTRSIQSILAKMRCWSSTT